MPDQPGHLGVGKSVKTVWDQVRPQFGIPWRSLKYIVPPFYSFIFMLLELQLISAGPVFISSVSEGLNRCLNRFSFVSDKGK
jgi:hypothetical protein